MNSKRALITGITGQDGSYLAELLLQKGYEVHGVVRRASTEALWRIEPVVSRLHLHAGDMTDVGSLARTVYAVQPDEVYNLAAQSHVGTSFEMPHYTMEVNAIGTLRLLEVCSMYVPACRFYQASSSEQFGNGTPDSGPPYNEESPFAPVSPYGISKTAAHRFAVMFRNAYKMHVSCGILFNHESERRGEQFVTRKITRGLSRIAYGLQTELELGDLSSRRDWGYAPEYVEMMWKMLQKDEPGDYVIARGSNESVYTFLQEAMRQVILREGVPYDMNAEYRIRDRANLRPIDIGCLEGDSRKAYDELGWRPLLSFVSLVRLMMHADMQRAADEKRMRDGK